MRVIKVKDYQEMSRVAAKIVAAQLYLKPNSVLGLATGSTPIGMYKELVRMHNEEGLDFSGAKSFNLDEYVNLPKENDQSYYYFMHDNLFNHINIKKENVNIPDGCAEDIEKFCKEYEAKINAEGGIDIQVLGIGINGHIGFNEPDKELVDETHLTGLTQETIESNSRFFASMDEVPKEAITMGVGTIVRAKTIMLLASGANKADAIYKTVKGGISTETPSSFLKLHKDVIVIVDEAAGKLI